MIQMATQTLQSVKVLDQQALIGFYEQHSTELFRYAYRMLGDNDLAEDCVAETFSRLLHAVHRGAGPDENARAWLYRVAHNWITDHYRRKSSQSLSIETDLYADPEGNPSKVVGKLLEQERVRKALLNLPSEQRLVVELRFLEEWPHESVAAVLGKSIEATRALQSRALSALRRMLLEAE